MSSDRPYPDVPAQPRFPELEERVIARWREQGTFRRSVEREPASGTEFVFYDGPPFANGLPHYGHLLTGFAKDVVPRYQTMRGKRVERRFGWDCHGLPAEMEAEKLLGVQGRAAIIEHGIAAFNETCRGLVGKYSTEWKHYVERQARWVDMENDYKTLDTPFMESVLWAFKQLWDKGARVRELPRHAVLVGGRDAALELRDTHGRQLPRAPGPGDHGALPAGGCR